MKKKLPISIPVPCHEDWNGMKISDLGRYCNVCSKVVVDFSDKKDVEIVAYMQQNLGKKVCGKFNSSQLQPLNLEIHQRELMRKRTFKDAFLLALFVVMGTSLFSCKTHDNNQLGEVVVVDDTLKNEEKLMGDTVYIAKDTTHNYEVLGLVLPDKKKCEKKK